MNDRIYVILGGLRLVFKELLLTLLSGAFLAFGIQVLVAAYGLNDPFSFVMTFFASNFIILISLAVMVGLVWRMKMALFPSEEPEEAEETEPDEEN